ncbi:MAG: alpha/beta hydrolase [Anaerolineae bacterium]|nr:alpha/beta hydrolase [Anaerolineae bacterium]
MSTSGDPDWRHFLQTEAKVHFVTFGEQRLRVIQVGSGAPLLLVHGFADSAYTWHRNLRPLAEAGFCAIAYDHPGCGESALPPGFRFGVDDLANVARGLLDALEIERAHLVGSSMGGGIGLQLALHHPDRLQRVVLVAPTCYHAPFRPWIFLARVAPLRELARRLAGPWLAGPIVRSQYGDDALLTPQVLAQYRQSFARPEYLHAGAGLLRDYWNRSFYDTARHYHEIEPALRLIWGDRDVWVLTRHYALRLAADTGAELTVIRGGGHLVQQNQPQRFNAAVIRFLRGH